MGEFLSSPRKVVFPETAMPFSRCDIFPGSNLNTGGNMAGSKTIAIVVVSLVCFLGPVTLQAQGPQMSALAPANLSKPRPAAPFNLTGMWLHDNSASPNS